VRAKVCPALRCASRMGPGTPRSARAPARTR
jgi:hypothetical protein